MGLFSKKQKDIYAYGKRLEYKLYELSKSIFDGDGMFLKTDGSNEYKGNLVVAGGEKGRFITCTDDNKDVLLRIGVNEISITYPGNNKFIIRSEYNTKTQTSKTKILTQDKSGVYECMEFNGDNPPSVMIDPVFPDHVVTKKYVDVFNRVAIDPGNSTATTIAGLVSDYNSLLQSLRDAGLLETTLTGSGAGAPIA